ncbi:hypothetical protein OIU78_025712 [Salix suchowensis]|nr:hypothetical protein OIU78_025712 [Salix suchowensis]
MKVIVVAGAREFLFEIGVQDSVLDIKRRIQQLVGVPVAAQILAVSGWELIDGLDMEDYPIVIDGTRIELTVEPMMPLFSSYCRKIQIIVKFSARQINIEVDRTDTVHFRNLSEYGIHEFSEIVVFLKTMSRARDDPPSRKLCVAVQTSSCLLNSARIPVEMKDSGTVNEMRQLLLSRKILPQDDYLFIHKQRIMRDNCSLRWHGVDNGDILYVFKGTVSRSGY